VIPSQKVQLNKEAQAEFRTALRLKPDYAEAQRNLGIALNDQGHHAEEV
jgi:Tfp pilus assembly protein PilF